MYECRANCLIHSNSLSVDGESCSPLSIVTGLSAGWAQIHHDSILEPLFEYIYHITSPFNNHA